ncbi:MAG: hypothetical protein HQL20_04685 [Candidatus Omnitrophica bacterium]|nr:hypothetical protein [Candidatus Omnitrophota bacterium]
MASFVRSVLSVALAVLIAFGPVQVYAQDMMVAGLPLPGAMVGPSAAYVPVTLRGLIINPDQPLNFDFIVDQGDSRATTAGVQEEAGRLVKYFLAAVTVPESDMWVNLSPYEQDRIMPTQFGHTELGRDMLAQDYVLKQVTASMLHPSTDTGKEFWSRVYAAAYQAYGSAGEEIPVDTLSKVWIMPSEAEVFEKNNSVYVTAARLKVLTQADYSAARGESPAPDHSQDVLREVIIPVLEKEVNEGANFAPLRQIYYASILAKWYRESIQGTLLAQAYAGTNKVVGVDVENKNVKEEIYQRYISAYKTGVFNFIKEEPTPEGDLVPRKYFSGGISGLSGGTLKRVFSVGAVATALFLMGTELAGAASEPVGAAVAQIDMELIKTDFTLIELNPWSAVIAAFAVGMVGTLGTLVQQWWKRSTIPGLMYVVLHGDEPQQREAAIASLAKRGGDAVRDALLSRFAELRATDRPAVARALVAMGAGEELAELYLNILGKGVAFDDAFQFFAGRFNTKGKETLRYGNAEQVIAVLTGQGVSVKGEKRTNFLDSVNPQQVNLVMEALNFYGLPVEKFARVYLNSFRERVSKMIGELPQSLSYDVNNINSVEVEGRALSMVTSAYGDVQAVVKNAVSASAATRWQANAELVASAVADIRAAVKKLKNPKFHSYEADDQRREAAVADLEAKLGRLTELSRVALKLANIAEIKAVVVEIDTAVNGLIKDSILENQTGFKNLVDGAPSELQLALLKILVTKEGDPRLAGKLSALPARDIQVAIKRLNQFFSWAPDETGRVDRERAGEFQQKIDDLIRTYDFKRQEAMSQALESALAVLQSMVDKLAASPEVATKEIDERVVQATVDIVQAAGMNLYRYLAFSSDDEYEPAWHLMSMACDNRRPGDKVAILHGLRFFGAIPIIATELGLGLVESETTPFEVREAALVLLEGALADHPQSFVNPESARLSLRSVRDRINSGALAGASKSKKKAQAAAAPAAPVATVPGAPASAPGTLPAAAPGAPIQDSAQNDVFGGIDIQEIMIRRSGSGAPVQFNAQAVSQVLADGFAGFSPRVLTFEPLSNAVYGIFTR